jgi:hypothetical protein
MFSVRRLPCVYCRTAQPQAEMLCSQVFPVGQGGLGGGGEGGCRRDGRTSKCGLDCVGDSGGEGPDSGNKLASWRRMSPNLGARLRFIAKLAATLGGDAAVARTRRWRCRHLLTIGFVLSTSVLDLQALRAFDTCKTRQCSVPPILTLGERLRFPCQRGIALKFQRILTLEKSSRRRFSHVKNTSWRSHNSPSQNT